MAGLAVPHFFVIISQTAWFLRKKVFEKTDYVFYVSIKLLSEKFSFREAFSAIL